MRVVSIALLAPVLFACVPAPVRAPADPPETPKFSDWRWLDRTCARADDPRHLERLHVPRDQPRHDRDSRELLVVPVTVDRGLAAPRSWLAFGSERPDISPFSWSMMQMEAPGDSDRGALSAGIEHVSQDRLKLAFAHGISTFGLGLHADVERRADGELVARIGAGGHTDLSQWDWSDMAGEIRLSTDRWHEPGVVLVVHIEVANRTGAMCGKFRLDVPGPGERRSFTFPFKRSINRPSRN